MSKNTSINIINPYHCISLIALGLDLGVVLGLVFGFALGLVPDLQP
jgi:hypothetical protein